MMAAQQVTLSALENQAFALMSRLHVIMRRESGRVTDIEYMRLDPQYCRHVLGLAEATGNADLQGICARLGDIYFAPGGLFPPAKKPVPPQMAEPAGLARDEDAPVVATLTAKAKAVQSYVGRLR
jgi:hypothetical protein